MEKRKLGNSDMAVSPIGLGCWVMSGSRAWEGTSDEENIRLIDKAIDLGVNFIDTAPVYGRGHSESIIGKAIKGKREKVYIATKCGVHIAEGDTFAYRHFSRKNVLNELDNSLKRIGSDYIDLYQIHWPDLQRPAEDIMETMNYIQSTGRIRYIGICNCPLALLDELASYGEITAGQYLYNMIDKNSAQFNGIHLLYRTEKEIWPYCVEKNIGGIPYMPLCQGLLTGAYDENTVFSPTDIRSKNPNLKGDKLKKNLKKVDAIRKIAQEMGKPLPQVAINWVSKNPAVTTVIAGSTTVEYLLDNIEAVSWVMDDSVYEKINEILDS
jgi:aryl-alcohol dehydrogenase-like predicted oxidoreductase